MNSLKYELNISSNNEDINIKQDKPKRKDTIMIKYNNQVKSIKDWSIYYNLDYHTFYNLYRRKNLTITDILNIMGIFEK